MKKLKSAVGITGASGSIYAKSILDTLQGNLNLMVFFNFFF
jgi:3-polyprenyl-4-hydroxybenzoate decarboxylase